MKRINCNEAFRMFGSIPGTATIEEHYPHRVKGWAFIDAKTGAPGYSETEEGITEACTMLHQYLGCDTFFLFSTHGHYKADWTFCGALIAE